MNRSVLPSIVENDRLIVILAIAVTAAAGYLAPLHPIAAATVVAGALFAVIVSMGRKTESLFLYALGALLTGYMLQGRGFAYWGVPPIYVGEIVLILGVLTLVLGRALWRFSALHILLILFMLLGLLRAIPGIADAGLLAVRDAAFCYYASYALLVSWLLNVDRVRSAFGWFVSILPFVTIWMLLMSTLFRYLPVALPHFPGSPLPLISVMKPGDRAVILTFLAALVLSGLYARLSPRRMPSSLFWACWLVSALVVAVENRGGILAMTIGLALLFVLQPSREWAKIALIGSLGLAILVVWNPTIDIGRNRDLSVQQLALNVMSIFTDETEGTGAVQGTKNWRLEFWSDIVDDTLKGPHFWEGRGFGVDLTAEYGYVVTNVENLRVPHNSLMTVLARMGVPGAALWSLLQVTFLVLMLRARRLARLSGDSLMEKIQTVLLATWLAGLVNSMFDAYLEGPQGAIPFWCVFGVGIAAIRVQERRSTRQVDSAPIAVE